MPCDNYHNNSDCGLVYTATDHYLPSEKCHLCGTPIQDEAARIYTRISATTDKTGKPILARTIEIRRHFLETH